MPPFATSRGVRRRALLTALIATPPLLLRPGLGLAAPAGGDAEGFISGLGQRTLAALTRRGADQEQRYREVAAMVDEAVDLDLIARLVLGRHWQAASDAQRRDYLRLFRAYTRDSLAQRFSAYSGGERFELTGSRAAGDSDTLVGTRIDLGGGRPPVSVDWRVRRDGDRLTVIDVVAEGVSMLVTNRSQVDAIVSSRGMDGLIADMRGWRVAGSRAGTA